MKNAKSRVRMLVAGAFALSLGGALIACAPTPQPASDTSTASESAAEPEASNPGGTASADASSSDPTEAIAVNWTPETDCAMCHTVEGESATNPATAAAAHGSVSCIECHDETDALAKQHDGVTTADLAPKRLKKTQVSDEGCLASGCHSLANIQATGAKSTVLTDANGLVANQHDLPGHEGHSEIVCSDCHKLHADTAELAGDAQQLCASCHHSGVYECYTCHEHS